jgi:histidinol-phosphate phosphatase family protein
VTFDLVIPTVGRSSLTDLLYALRDQAGPMPERIYLVDDRRQPTQPLIHSGLDLGWLTGRIRVIATGGRGPAAARNRGWRSASADWIAFLDDDVRATSDWLKQLALDLEAAPLPIAASQGRLRVPLPVDRRPTDWERNVAALQGARWITADIAYRRSALEQLGGFDERFKRAYREDAELALRAVSAGYQLVTGNRSSEHPVRQASAWISLRAQAGNIDDALVTRIHGRDWYRKAGSPKGRRGWHVVTTLALIAGLSGLFTGRRWASRAGLTFWALATGDFAWRRIRPGPRTRSEVLSMLLTSLAIPPLAVGYWLAGLWRWRSAARLQVARPAAVLFDRDGTLLEDVPYNGDPGRVVPMPTARAALDQLRARGILVGVVSNQSGVGRGLISLDQVTAVNQRLEQLLGPVDSWAVCTHRPDDSCECRKPAPGLVLRSAAELGVEPRDCVVVGDIGSDMQAAMAAGARGILVPTERTLPGEVAAAPEVARDLLDAVNRAMGGQAA